MRLTPRSKPNCWLEAPGWGTIPLVATTVGYGMSVIQRTPDGASRTRRTFYPWVRTSGVWYIEIEHGSRQERDMVNAWLLFYVSRITDPRLTPLAPVSVTVPARNFHKVGYPQSSMEFGDAHKISRYSSVIQFSSASDPALSSQTASSYVPVTDSLFFHPGGVQMNASPSNATVIPPPISGPDPYRDPL